MYRQVGPCVALHTMLEYCETRDLVLRCTPRFGYASFRRSCAERML